jgi:ATP-dependent protease HslVU (ClpYQ) ATPase subunit
MKLLVVWALVASMIVVGAVPANAGFVGSKTVAIPEFDRDADLAQVRTVLEQKVVRSRLADVGYTGADIEKRLSDMSDLQVHRLATDLNEVRTGEGAVGFVIGVLLVVLLVIVILEVAD